MTAETSPQEAIERQKRDAKQRRDELTTMMAAAIYVFNDATDADAPSRAFVRAKAFMDEAERRGMNIKL